MVLAMFLPRKAADSAIMKDHRRTAHAYAQMQSHKSLMLCWRSFLGHSRNVATTIVVLKGGQ